jgi:hypothetical protein
MCSLDAFVNALVDPGKASRGRRSMADLKAAVTFSACCHLTPNTVNGKPRFKPAQQRRRQASAAFISSHAQMSALDRPVTIFLNKNCLPPASLQ